MNNLNYEDPVTGPEALYESMMKCKRGVMWKDSTVSFVLRGTHKTAVLSRQIQKGTYKPRPPRHFKVTYPKPRDIVSISFRDRVYQRSLNDKIVYPVMTRSFIYDNYACQKGKGTDAARERLKSFLRSFYRRYGTSGYVAQFDIHGYYPNMDHEVTEEIFRKKLPPDVFAQVQKILRDQYEGDKGYSPGSQLVQIAGISVLDGMDHFIKEQLHARYYIRYMDDFLILHPDKEVLQEMTERVINYLDGLRFTVNPKKTRIYPLSRSVTFLGFQFRLTDTGKVLMFIDPGKVKAERRKLRRLVAKAKRDDLPKSVVDESYASWRNHASKGNSYRLLQRMDKYYHDLWRDSDEFSYREKQPLSAGPGRNG